MDIESGAELQPYQNFDRAFAVLKTSKWEVITPDEKISPSFLFWALTSAQNKRHFTRDIAVRQIMLSCSHAQTPTTHSPQSAHQQQQRLAGRVCEILAVWGSSWSCLHHRGWDSRCTRLIEANSHAHFRGKGGRWGGGGVVWYWTGLIFMQNAPIWVEASNLLLREVPVAVGRSLSC